MAGIRELRGRIVSVRNIKQITRAMEMVATTKLRRFQDRAVASRPYAQEIATLVAHLAAVLGDEVADRPLFNPGAGTGKVALLLVSSDRGLCGAYNSNLFRTLEAWLVQHPGVEVQYHVYGRKAYQYLGKRGRAVERLFQPELERVDYRAAARTSKALVDTFLEGRCERVVLLYTAFESMVKYVPRLVELLPIESGSLAGGDAAELGDVILEPDAQAIFDGLIPRYLETRVYNALIEALTSEYASRRVAMKNATDAAGEMQAELKSIYNRKRQETITKDLLDIVGGAEALR